MSIVQVIIIMGAACVSPVDSAPTTTTAYKVPCAIVVSGGGETTIAKDLSRVEPAKAEPARAPVAKKKVACRKKWYWKNHKKRWRCVR